VLSIVGNSKIFSDTIQNFSANPFRRVELKCQLAGSADHVSAMELLRSKLQTIPNVVATRKSKLKSRIQLVGPVLAVRPFCHTDHYWQCISTQPHDPRSARRGGLPTPMPAQLILTHTA